MPCVCIPCLYGILCGYFKRAIDPVKYYSIKRQCIKQKNCEQLLAFHVQMPKENANLISCLSRNSPFFLYSRYDWLTFYGVAQYKASGNTFQFKAGLHLPRKR